ncbi:hypothetical protein RHGRI_025474 [Rhododendron griersonianum]|uniref:Gnk2-homologous domain-containing protein n=1 Tax=Rhododendron griersonianum TaxID=479676 RepID=A0AAV6ITU8_9ERIC|nr:hypothetical protein RHGRI_025474 [Rhododendron griersonianum]
MGFRRTLFLCHIVLINLVSLTVAQRYFLSHSCKHNDSTSAYQTNRDTLLSTLANKTDQYGFYTSSTGENPDTVYALVLCRPDAEFCQECINNATTKLKELCPDGKEAIGWYDDCMLRTGRKFASDNAPGPDNIPIYAFTQCTPDLSKQDCDDCLQQAIEDIPNCCSFGPVGGRVLKPSCNFRYDNMSFLGGFPGFFGASCVFEGFTVGLVLFLAAIGLYRRIVANHSPPRRRRPRPDPISGPKNPPVQGSGLPPIQDEGPPVSGPKNPPVQGLGPPPIQDEGPPVSGQKNPPVQGSGPPPIQDEGPPGSGP